MYIGYSPKRKSKAYSILLELEENKNNEILFTPVKVFKLFHFEKNFGKLLFPKVLFVTVERY